jgi:hypothetical protein
LNAKLMSTAELALLLFDIEKRKKISKPFGFGSRITLLGMKFPVRRPPCL